MLRWFRTLGWIEGVSLLLLLFVAMPLKYYWGLPQAVRAVGWVHGLLFVGYVVFLAPVSSERSWPWQRTLTAFVAAVLPFGTFLFDRSLARELSR